MPGLNLLLKALRRGLLAPAERAGLFPSRYYVALAVRALEADDLDGAVAALEACTRRRGPDARAALAREQTIFRSRTLAAGHAAAAARAEARAGYLEGLAREGRRRLTRARARRRALSTGALIVALAAAAAAGLAAAGGPAAAAGSAPATPLALVVLALLAVGAVAVAAVAARATPRPVLAALEGEAARLVDAAQAERRAAAAEREAAGRLARLETRLAAVRPALPRAAADEAPPPAVVLRPDDYRQAR